MYRKEFYNAGRLLMFNGHLHAAGIMLGYAVEFSLKKGLLATGFPEDDRIIRKHEIVKLFNKCLEQKIFEDVQVSNDFVEFVDHRLNLPLSVSGASLIEEARNRSRYYHTHLDAYDDFLIRLDDATCLRVGDPWSKLSWRAKRLHS